MFQPKTILGSPTLVAACRSPLTLSTDYNGIDQEVDYGPVAKCKPNFTEAWTGNIWVKFSGLQEPTFFSQIRTSTGWSMRAETNGVDFELIGPRAALDTLETRTLNAGGAPSINDGAWHMLTAAVDGNNPLTGADIHLFIDAVEMTGGMKASSGSVNTNTQNGSAALVAGNADTQNNWMDGLMCHASYHNFSLSAAQVAEMYGDTPGSGLGCPQDLDALSFASPVFWDTLGDGDGCGAGAMLDIGSGAAANGTMSNCNAGQFTADVPP